MGINGSKTFGTLFFGTISGGFGSVLTGGNFWYGSATGLIVSGLNHVMHSMEVNSTTETMLEDGDPPVKKKETTLEPWDLNGDGKLSKFEADHWWIMGNGKEIIVDGNKIDLTGFNKNSTKYNPKTQIYAYDTVDIFRDLPYGTAATYGGSIFKLVNEQWQMQSQKYHYQMRNWRTLKNIARNMATIWGKPITKGVDYNIKIVY